jgi:hypothetical protein
MRIRPSRRFWITVGLVLVCALVLALSRHQDSWQLRPSTRIALSDPIALPGGSIVELKLRFEPPLPDQDPGGMVRVGLGPDAGDSRYDAAPPPPNAHPADGLVLSLSQCRHRRGTRFVVERWQRDRKVSERSATLALTPGEWHVLQIKVEPTEVVVSELSPTDGEPERFGGVPLTAPTDIQRRVWPVQVSGGADVAWLRTGATGDLGIAERRDLAPWAEYPPNHGQVTFADDVLRLGTTPNHGAHAFRLKPVTVPCNLRFRVIAHDAPWGPDHGSRGGTLHLYFAEPGLNREAEMTDRRNVPAPRNGVEIVLNFREGTGPGQQYAALYRHGQRVESSVASLGLSGAYHQWHTVLIRLGAKNLALRMNDKPFGTAPFSTKPGVQYRLALMGVSGDIEIADWRVTPEVAP